MRLLIALTLAVAALAAGDPAAQTLTVADGGDLQDALIRVRPGGTVLLARGATFVGNFVLPARTGRGQDQVITVRTAGDEGLPAEGERIAPEHAGVLAKLRSPNPMPALRTAPGARGWRIVLVEFAPSADGSGDVIALGDGSSAQRTLESVPADLTLDRVYIHGDPSRPQKRGVALNAGTTRIAGCYISDIKAVGQDSQAIAGWNGPGGYTIENNYLEAAGENIMFGGADPSIPDLTPSDIVVRGNVLSKPLAWHGAGAPKWQVKNLFELKNARRVLVERNLMERSWQQAQTGYGVLFTVRNQDGDCPWCQVEQVEFRENVVRDVGAGMQILGTDPVHPSRQTNRIVVRGNLFDGIDREAWGGDGYFLLLSDAPRAITIDGNTIVQKASAGLIKIAHGVTQQFVFTNNIAGHGQYGIIGRDRGVGNDSIAAYLPGADISHNVIAGGRAAAYPKGNAFPAAEDLARRLEEFHAQGYGADLTRLKALLPGSAFSPRP